MTIQEFTDALQIYANHGHAQDEILIEVGYISPSNIELRPFGVGQTILICGK